MIRAPVDHGQRRCLPAAFVRACRIQQVFPTRFVLVVRISRQEVCLFEKSILSAGKTFHDYQIRRSLRASTSRFGTGQQAGSRQTPLGLHRVAEKIGAGYPIGTVFASRQPAGFTWQGQSDAPIAHRILRLEGLEPGFNRGGQVDSHSRYIYIHGVGDESNLGRPASKGCIHLAAADLLPLFDLLPAGSLVWIDGT
jgi:L,D-transpeptidase YbiS